MAWLPSRWRTMDATTIVVHASAGRSAASSIAWLWQVAKDAIKGNEASYNYMIERDGVVTKLVPLSRVAFHAGRSMGPNGPNVNGYSIGICFANLNDGKEEITPRQRKAFQELVLDIIKETPSVVWLTRHRDISPGRKTDPMLFDLDFWARVLRLKAWRQ